MAFDAKSYIHGLFETYKQTSDYKDSIMMEIACRRQEFEKNLDDMWANYQKFPAQIIEYQKGVNQIKEAGFKVLRNSAGKHKIVNK